MSWGGDKPRGAALTQTSMRVHGGAASPSIGGTGLRSLPDERRSVAPSFERIEPSDDLAQQRDAAGSSGRLFFLFALGRVGRARRLVGGFAGCIHFAGAVALAAEFEASPAAAAAVAGLAGGGVAGSTAHGAGCAHLPRAAAFRALALIAFESCRSERNDRRQRKRGTKTRSKIAFMELQDASRP